MIDPGELSPLDIRRVAARLRGGGLMRLVDSTLLRPEATRDAVLRHVDEAARLQAHVCIAPCHLQIARERLAQLKPGMRHACLLSTVVGFPLGNSTTSAKAAEAREYLGLGAEEIDMVANAGLLKGGNRDCWRRDVDAVAEVVAAHAPAGKRTPALKVIIECCYLDDREKRFAAETVAEIGRERKLPIFVKTSTGMAQPGPGLPPGATLDDVLLIRKAVGDYCADANPVGVKAAGGIGDATAAVKMIIAAGAVDYDLELLENAHLAARIGTSAADAVSRDFDLIYGGAI